MYGRGTCDMKAGVAAMVVAAEHAAARGPRRRRRPGAGGGRGARQPRHRRGARTPRGAAPGRVHRRRADLARRDRRPPRLLRARGRDPRPRGALVAALEGVNAVTLLGRLLGAVEARDGELAAREPHPYAGHGSLMATVVRGGSAPFTLAARASATVERRTVPGEPLDAGLREVETIIAALALPTPRAGSSSRATPGSSRTPPRAAAPRVAAVRGPGGRALLDGVRAVGGRGRADRGLRSGRRRPAHRRRMGRARAASRLRPRR